MASEVRGYTAVRSRTQKWRGFYENPVEYLNGIAKAATDAARADMASGAGATLAPSTIAAKARRGAPTTPLVDTGFILANLRPIVRPGKRKHVYEAGIVGPSFHPKRGATKARAVTFRRKRKGVAVARTVQFKAQASMHWIAIMKAIYAQSEGRIQFPRPAVIRSAVKPAVDRIKEMAKLWTEEAKQLESQREAA